MRSSSLSRPRRLPASVADAAAARVRRGRGRYARRRGRRVRPRRRRGRRVRGCRSWSSRLRLTVAFVASAADGRVRRGGRSRGGEERRDGSRGTVEPAEVR
ncbi:unnamed protein product [Closterium sp. NIES-54]